jgi:hypothetical protein
VSGVKSDVEPTACHGESSCSNRGAAAKPIAGSTIAAPAIPPIACTPMVKAARRFMDSPSK